MLYVTMLALFFNLCCFRACVFLSLSLCVFVSQSFFLFLSFFPFFLFFSFFLHLSFFLFLSLCSRSLAFYLLTRRP
uniref:Uncharacterized protein n=1 Tax=Rhipicephalus pulchellus TaxID=72859 RepID=L7LZ46_RHIPC